MVEIHALCPNLDNGLSYLKQNIAYIVRPFITAMNMESLLYSTFCNPIAGLKLYTSLVEGSETYNWNYFLFIQALKS
jgi:hypothetical protein